MPTTVATAQVDLTLNTNAMQPGMQAAEARLKTLQSSVAKIDFNKVGAGAMRFSEAIGRISTPMMAISGVLAGGAMREFLKSGSTEAEALKGKLGLVKIAMGQLGGRLATQKIFGRDASEWASKLARFIGQIDASKLTTLLKVALALKGLQVGLGVTGGMAKLLGGMGVSVGGGGLSALIPGLAGAGAGAGSAALIPRRILNYNFGETFAEEFKNNDVIQLFDASGNRRFNSAGRVIVPSVKEQLPTPMPMANSGLLTFAKSLGVAAAAVGTFAAVFYGIKKLATGSSKSSKWFDALLTSDFTQVGGGNSWLSRMQARLNPFGIEPTSWHTLSADREERARSEEIFAKVAGGAGRLGIRSKSDSSLIASADRVAGMVGPDGVVPNTAYWQAGAFSGEMKTRIKELTAIKTKQEEDIKKRYLQLSPEEIQAKQIGIGSIEKTIAVLNDKLGVLSDVQTAASRAIEEYDAAIKDKLASKWSSMMAQNDAAADAQSALAELKTGMGSRFQKIIGSYASNSASGRQNMMDRLAALKPSQGISRVSGTGVSDEFARGINEAISLRASRKAIYDAERNRKSEETLAFAAALSAALKEIEADRKAIIEKQQAALETIAKNSSEQARFNEWVKTQ